MRSDLTATAAGHGDVFTRAEARSAGYSPAEIRALTRPNGPWVVVRRGVYAERELWDRLPEHPDRWRLRDHAAHLSLTRPHTMSHDSAVRLLGLDMLRPRTPLVHVSRLGLQATRVEAGVKHHRHGLSLGDLVTVDGIGVTGPVRLVVDVTREHGLATGLTVADAMKRADPDLDLSVGLDAWEHLPGLGLAREAVALADPGAETVGESMARLLVRDLGIGEPETQFPVRLRDGSVAFADLRVGCHLFEFDGRVKYLGQDQGGVADTAVTDVLWREKKRERSLCAEGLGMSRVIWEDLWGEKRRQALERLREEYAVTVRRYGDRLPAHLEEFARRMAGHRARRLPRVLPPWRRDQNRVVVA